MMAGMYHTECPKCGEMMDLDRKTMVYTCPSCEYRISKDDYEEGRWRRA